MKDMPGSRTRPRLATALALTLAGIVSAAAAEQPPQPQPFPRPGGQPPPAPDAPAAPAAPPVPAVQRGPAEAPTEAELGIPIYPAAQFLASYDAGRGQRFYLFGVSIGFVEAVTYYRNVLRTRGTVVFDTPATHLFEIGRFREDTMAFPPGVTIKDFAWGGSGGYPNPVRGALPERFPTIIQIVPPPGGRFER